MGIINLPALYFVLLYQISYNVSKFKFCNYWSQKYFKISIWTSSFWNWQLKKLHFSKSKTSKLTFFHWKFQAALISIGMLNTGVESPHSVIFRTANHRTIYSKYSQQIIYCITDCSSSYLTQNAARSVFPAFNSIIPLCM